MQGGNWEAEKFSCYVEHYATARHKNSSI